MKKASSATLRRAWPSTDMSERFVPVPLVPAEPPRTSRRSRSEKDYRNHKHSKPHRHPPQYMCQSPPAYVQPGTIHDANGPELRTARHDNQNGCFCLLERGLCKVLHRLRSFLSFTFVKLPPKMCETLL